MTGVEGSQKGRRFLNSQGQSGLVSLGEQPKEQRTFDLYGL